MPVGELYIDTRTAIFGDRLVEVHAEDSGMKCSFDAYLSDFMDALQNIEDDILEWMAERLEHRAENAWDESEISDEDYEAFKKVLKVIA